MIEDKLDRIIELLELLLRKRDRPRWYPVYPEYPTYPIYTYTDTNINDNVHVTDCGYHHE